jgi:hypothetical protein
MYTVTVTITKNEYEYIYVTVIIIAIIIAAFIQSIYLFNRYDTFILGICSIIIGLVLGIYYIRILTIAENNYLITENYENISGY